ncbi:hypothetical protein CANARDRAFT_29873 [[Candida] arabinofermentans NRRL YB-2248]|uniref:Alanyl-transfer RNA synthetases family profile domain-containing protein n=1 Tax=[Candida] arabinofermentans NRRL YB-2248 TaxID=983967 RepID=A0A1E4SVZ7_9ASCO|nr:hypothetical protein CANARDRAFT_29873 [[Candida] arabinofermentans NRRL YB-2248]
MASTVVGALACQRDSYLKSFATKVISCRVQKPEPAAASAGKKKSKTEQATVPKELYEVELEDTILFPEGGGQPSDTGVLICANGEKKLNVGYIKRDGLKAIHVLEEPLEVGDSVQMTLDWNRRFDHMQQHTGQHLLSAIMDKYELPTLSWSMGDLINYIEVPRKITNDELAKINAEVNLKIVENLPIKVEIPDKDDVKKDKMPDDYDLDKGVLRVIHIGELDSNPCCGTHLSSTGQIQAIALLNQVSGKGSNSRLNFVVGDRIVKYTQFSHSILRELVNNLSCQTEAIVEKVNNISITAKKSQSRELSFVKELAIYKAKELIQELETKDVVYCHRSDVGLEFMNQVFKEMSPLSKGTVVLMTGENKEGGAMVVFGEKVEEIVQGLKKCIGGLKGGGKGKFQGKITTYEKGELESATRYLDSL